ncbi:zinc-binding alcohol dehydrogenase [Truepera radiovictrix DSM 17093]|uniref:Zinc-binding alcohol dehydrogenase n=1 Tax=Truepera radiovictrix (strain DSM 17093 / CIP 108686 / LMG 22925 / RQ-24) TaxID=649638 RepID=D7CU75_TRURR|nr:zinc-binding alcohol dehydrogenase [Truepera radiovictrix DSM 17093]
MRVCARDALMRRFGEHVETTSCTCVPTFADADLAATLLLAAIDNARRPLDTLGKTPLRAAQALGVAASDAGIGAP